MTYPISDVTRRVVYSGSAGTGPYSFSFEILDEGDIAVYENDTLLTITTDYTVTINADGTGSVTLVSASTASDTVAILGNKGIERQTDFVTGGDLFASSLNDELDAQTIFAQQNAEGLTRAIKIPPQSSLSIDTTLTVPQANYILGWNDTGDAILNLQEIGSWQGSDATTTTANYNNRDIVKDSSNSNVYICTAASTAGTLLTNTSYWELLVDAAAAASSASAAATSASNAATSETNAATSASNASDAQGYAEEWANKAEDSLVSVAAGGDGSTEYSAKHWAAKAEDEKIASAASAAAAASDAAGVAALYDAFDDRYLGSKASDPALDNDGNALTDGALYFNTTSNVLKVYDLGTTTWLTIPQLTLASMTDVTLTSIASGEILKWNGSEWINNTLAEAGIASTSDITNMLETTDIGVTVQGYDADTLKADTADTLTASFRGSVTTDNDLSFDMNTTNNFSCTPTANGTLTFTNITAGQSGNIYLVNGSNYAISAAATTYISAADLSAISASGTYYLSYYSPDGTNVMVSASAAVTSAGA